MFGSIYKLFIAVMLFSLAVIADPLNLRVWHEKTDAQKPVNPVLLVGHSQLPEGIAVFKYKIATASNLDKTVRIWNQNTLEQTLLINAASYFVAFSPDGKKIAITTGKPNNDVLIIDATGGKTLATLKGHTDLVYGAQFSPDGTRIATASWDKSGRVWDAVTGKQLQALPHAGAVHAVSYGDDQVIATASHDHSVKIWDKDGKLIRTLGHKSNVYSVAFSLDGNKIATGSDKEVYIWDTKSGIALKTIGDHYGMVVSVAFGKNNQLITSSSDGYVRVMDANSGKSIFWLLRDNVMAGAAAVTKDGIVAGYSDGVVNIWKVDEK